MDIQAAQPLPPTLDIIITEYQISQNQLLGTLPIMLILVPTCLILAIPPKYPQCRFLLPLILRFQLLQDRKKHFHSREKWQNNVANSMPIILRKSQLPIPIALNLIFVA
jgi:hypothetical protein